MFDAAFALPEQVAAAARAALDAPLALTAPHDATGQSPDRSGEPVITAVVLLGVGPGAVAAHGAVALAETCPVPLVVCEDFEPPAFVGATTPVLAVSHSGRDDEVAAAARASLDAGAPLVALTSGGELAQLASRSGADLVELDPAIPSDRSATAAMTVATLTVLERLGLYSGIGEQVGAAVEQLTARRDQLAAEQTPAVRLARRIGRTLPIVHGGGALGGVAARHWKSQFNQNPKIPAFDGSLPRLLHDEVSGWAQHGDVTRQVFSLVLLRHGGETAVIARQLDAVAELCEEIVADVHPVSAQGEGSLARLLDLMLVGDLVSLHLAVDAGVDPGPVPITEDLRRSVERS